VIVMHIFRWLMCILSENYDTSLWRFAQLQFLIFLKHKRCSVYHRKTFHEKYLLNHLETKRRLLYLKIRFVPRSKHFISVIKTNQLCCMEHKSLFVLR